MAYPNFVHLVFFYMGAFIFSAFWIFVPCILCLDNFVFYLCFVFVWLYVCGHSHLLCLSCVTSQPLTQHQPLKPCTCYYPKDYHSCLLYVETLDVSYPQIANDLQHCCPKKVATKIRLNTNFFRGALINIGAPFTKTKNCFPTIQQRVRNLRIESPLFRGK